MNKPEIQPRTLAPGEMLQSADDVLPPNATATPIVGTWETRPDVSEPGVCLDLCGADEPARYVVAR